MIDMPVRNDQMVNSVQSRLGGNTVNAFGIAGAGVAAIDQDGFAQRRDEQGGGSARAPGGAGQPSPAAKRVVARRGTAWAG